VHTWCGDITWYTCISVRVIVKLVRDGQLPTIAGREFEYQKIDYVIFQFLGMFANEHERIFEQRFENFEFQCMAMRNFYWLFTCPVVRM